MGKGDLTSSQIVGIVIAIIVIVLAVMILMKMPNSQAPDEANLRGECTDWQRFNYASNDALLGGFSKTSYPNLWKKFVPVKIVDKKEVEPDEEAKKAGETAAKNYCTWQTAPDCTAKDACGEDGCTEPEKCLPKDDNSGCECMEAK